MKFPVPLIILFLPSPPSPHLSHSLISYKLLTVLIVSCIVGNRPTRSLTIVRWRTSKRDLLPLLEKVGETWKKKIAFGHTHTFFFTHTHHLLVLPHSLTLSLYLSHTHTHTHTPNGHSWRLRCHWQSSAWWIWSTSSLRVWQWAGSLHNPFPLGTNFNSKPRLWCQLYWPRELGSCDQSAGRTVRPLISGGSTKKVELRLWLPLKCKLQLTAVLA